MEEEKQERSRKYNPIIVVVPGSSLIVLFVRFWEVFSGSDTRS